MARPRRSPRKPDPSQARLDLVDRTFDEDTASKLAASRKIKRKLKGLAAMHVCCKGDELVLTPETTGEIAWARDKFAKPVWIKAVLVDHPEEVLIPGPRVYLRIHKPKEGGR